MQALQKQTNKSADNSICGYNRVH